VLMKSDAEDETSKPMDGDFHKLPGRELILTHVQTRTAFVLQQSSTYREVTQAHFLISAKPSRQLEFRAPETVTLTRLEDLSAGMVHGPQVWPAGVALADYILSGNGNELQGATVCELGCGWALPGMAAACMGASHVICTDLPDVVEALQKCMPPDLSEVSVRAFDWDSRGVDQLLAARVPDLVLCADCIYAPLYPQASLIRALTTLKVRTLLAVQRRPADGCEQVIERLALEGLVGDLVKEYSPCAYLDCALVQIWDLEWDGLDT